MIRRVSVALAGLVLVFLAGTVVARPTASSAAEGRLAHAATKGSAWVAQGCQERGAPGPPTGLTVTRVGIMQVTLSWIPPAYKGVSPLTGYTIDGAYTSDSEALAGGESASGVANTGWASTSYTLRGLVANQTYYFAVTADNAVGESCPSNVKPAHTQAAGGTTGGPSGTLPGNSGGGGGSAAPPLVIGGVAAIGAGAGALLVVRRRRSRSRHDVRAVPNSGPPGVVNAHTTGTQPTRTIRIEPHPGASSTTIEEPRS